MEQRKSEERVPSVMIDGDISIISRFVKTEIGNKYILQKAKSLVTKGDIVQAHYMYVKFFESFKDASKCPESSVTEFMDLVIQVSVILEDCDQFEDLIKIYLQALQFFPNNYVIMNEMGSYLCRSGQETIGKKYIQEALKICPIFLPAEKNLTYLKWNEFPRWQFSMMNTMSRNVAYLSAINIAIKKGYKKVLDIGSGCGLLSLMASADPEVKVTAIEENKTLCDISKKIFHDYERKNVTVIFDNSNNLLEIPESANLLVTEIFDAAVFGEHALNTLIHANKVLLDKDSITIPLGATIYATGIFCRESFTKYRLINKIPELGIEKMCIRIREDEPYDTQRLHFTKSKHLTSTTKILDVNFSDINCLEQLASNEWFTDIELLGFVEGVVTQIGVWFQLTLDENIKISSDPQSGTKCWEQAIFQLEHPFYIKQNQQVKVRVYMKNNHFVFKPHQSYNCLKCFIVSKEIVSFLSDKELVKKVVGLASKYNGRKFTICDTAAFPLFGMLMAKQGSYFYHFYSHIDDLNFMLHLLEINKINKSCYAFMEMSDFVTFSHVINGIDLIFNEVITDGGSLKRFETKHVTLTKWNPLIIPQKIQLCFKLVESDFLDFHNKIDDRNVMNYKISHYLKEYTGDEHPYLSRFEHNTLSSVQVFKELLYLNNEESIKTTIEVKVNSGGKINGILYWFNLILDCGIELNTINSTHYSKSCFILEEPRAVRLGEIVSVSIHQYQNHLKIHL